MATFRCLTIPEILLHICDNLSKPDLIQFGLTATRFLDTSMNAVWRTQTSLVPLLKCLPSDSWVATQGPSSTQSPTDSLAIIRPLVFQDWERVESYTKRVKSLLLYNQAPHSLASGILEEIVISLPTSTQFFLPQLQELTCPDDDAFFTHVRLFLPPTLTTFKIRFSPLDPQHSRYNTFIALHRLCPKITSLMINHYHESGNEANVDRILTKFPLLRQIAIHPMPASNLHCVLSSLPRLTNAAFIVSSRGGSEFGEGDQVLPDVTNIKLLNASFLFAFELISRIASPSLDTISLQPILGNRDESILFMQSLEAHRSSLRTIRLNGDNHRLTADTEPNYQLDAGILKHLFSLPALTTINIGLNVALSIDDEFIVTLASKCSQLRTLYIISLQTRHPPKISSQKHITLNGFRSVLLRCPHLSEISLVIDTTIPLAPLEAQSASRNQKVTRIHVGHSPITNSIDVAIALAPMLPNLSQIVTTAPAGGCCVTEWTKVVEHLEVARALRTS